MQSKHQSSSGKTRERKIAAMRKLKEAYDLAKASGTIKSYKVTPQD